MAYPTRFQPAQPNALRILNRKYSELERSKLSSAQKLTQGLRAAAWELAFKFGQSTTIHGLNRLLGRTSGKYERLIWLLTVVTAFLGAIYVCLILSDRFTEGKLETVVDSTRMPVYFIAFPVITICNLNHLNWERLNAAKERFLPHENSTEVLQLFERIVSTYDQLHFGGFDAFSVLEGQPLERLNHVNFSQVAEFMTWHCDELLAHCEWNHFPLNCCEFFSKRRGKNGLCWAFNTLETEEGKRMEIKDHFYPWHTGSAGPGSGLKVKVLINPEKHFPNATNSKGIRVMTTEQYVWHKDPMDIPENTNTLMNIDPVTYFYDNNTHGLSSNLRECIFMDEQNSQNFKTLYGYVYMIENCQSQCHQEYLIKYCNCTVDLLFPPAQYRSCSAVDLPCLARNNQHFLFQRTPGEDQYVKNHYEGMVCKCFRNCYSLHFLTDVRPSILSPEIRGNLSYVDLDIHYASETMIRYRTSLIFGWVDLLVAFGGIAGLFLGCSLISAMELGYFLFIELPTFAYTNLKQNSQRNHGHMDSMRSLHANNNRLIGARPYDAYMNNDKPGQHFARASNWQQRFTTPNLIKINY